VIVLGEVNNMTFILFQRMYKSGDSDSMHKYTLHSDHPDFIRAKINAQQISDVSFLGLLREVSQYL